MQESLGIKLQLAAIALSEELDYARAAEKLHISVAELKLQIVELEKLLQFQIFEMDQDSLVVTIEGRFVLKECRNFLALYRQDCCHPAVSDNEVRYD